MNANDGIAEFARWACLFFANHVWQATIFAAFAGLASLALGRGPARTRAIVWLVASVKFALPLSLFAYIGGLLGVGLSPTTAVSPAAVQPAAASVIWTIVEPVAIAEVGRARNGRRTDVRLHTHRRRVGGWSDRVSRVLVREPSPALTGDSRRKLHFARAVRSTRSRWLASASASAGTSASSSHDRFTSPACGACCGRSSSCPTGSETHSVTTSSKQ